MRPRIYTDTSVIGGCLDPEFEGPTRRFFRQVERGSVIMVVSDLTRLELKGAPNRVQQILADIPGKYVQELLFTEEASRLADRYLAAKVIGEAHQTDARHIATATVHGVTALVSWNFKHIVNLQRIHGYNRVNAHLGYPHLEIRTPWEVLGHEDQD